MTYKIPEKALQEAAISLWRFGVPEKEIGNLLGKPRYWVDNALRWHKANNGLRFV